MSDRDVRKPKSPPAGVRAQTAGPVDEDARTRQRIASLRAELTQLEGGIPEREIDEFEARTPVNINPIERLEFRQRRTSRQVENVAKQASGLAVDIAKVEARVESVDGKLEKLLDAEIADRRAREQRAEAARIELERAKAALEADERKARATAEAEERKAAAELRRTGAAYRAKILLAIIALLGSIFGGYFVGRGGV